MGQSLMFDTLIIEDFLPQEQISSIFSTVQKADFISPDSSPHLKVLAFNIDGFPDISKKRIESLYGKEVLAFKGLSMLRYDSGDAINPHQDFAESYEDENDFKPIISLILYLNSDYEGGELCIGSQDKSEVFLKLKPRPGTAIIFDAKHFHWTEPVISGIRYSYTAFYKI